MRTEKGSCKRHMPAVIVPKSVTNKAMIVKVSPMWADCFALCPRRFLHTCLRHDLEEVPSATIHRGQAVHRALAMYNRLFLHDGTPPNINRLIDGMWPPRSQDGASQENVVHFAATCLHSYALLLQESHLRVRSIEQSITTWPRRLTPDSGIAVVLVGRPDVILTTDTNVLVSLDFKTDSIVPMLPDVATLPSTSIYRMLAEHWYPDATVHVVMRFLTDVGECVQAQLTDNDITASWSLIQRMATAIIASNFKPTPGEYCGQCPVLRAVACPAHTNVVEPDDGDVCLQEVRRQRVSETQRALTDRFIALRGCG